MPCPPKKRSVNNHCHQQASLTVSETTRSIFMKFWHFIRNTWQKKGYFGFLHLASGFWIKVTFHLKVIIICFQYS